jgi:hypothetical protein
MRGLSLLRMSMFLALFLNIPPLPIASISQVKVTHSLPPLIMHHYDASEKASAVFAAKGVNTWEVDIWEPDDWEEVDGKIKAILKGNPKALLLLRVGLPLYPDDEEHKRDIATAEDGTRWTQMLGKAKWFKIGEVTNKDAPAGKWTHIVLDISHIDRKGVCRLWDFLIWHNEPIIPKGAKLRFYIDDIEYYSSIQQDKRFVADDMEKAEGIYDQERYPSEPLFTEQVAHSGKRALVWEHLHDGQHDGLIFRGVDPAMDLSAYDRFSFWIYPETPYPFRIEVRICGGLQRMGYPSLASEKWLNDCKIILKNLIRHIDSMPYRNHILGFTLAGGLTAEWAWAGASADCGVDFSPSAKVSWQRFLKKRYGTIDNLKRAWGREGERYSDFGDIGVPGKDIRYAKPELGDFFSPAKHKAFIDYNEFTAEAVSRDIISLAKTVKEESKERLLVGVLFSYMGGYGDMLGKQAQQTGHAMPEEVIKSPYVDYIASPLFYWDRKLGGSGIWWLPVDSLKLHGKIPVNEADTPSHLVKVGNWLQPGNLWESIQVLRRDASATIAKGMVEWHFFGNLGAEASFEKAPELVDEIGRLNELLKSSLQSNCSSQSEVAVIIDRHSLLCLHPNSYLPGFIYYQLPELARMGAPFDIYLLSDIEALLKKNYKVVIFLNTYWLKITQRKVIEKLKNNGRTLVFLYADGIVDDKNVDVNNIFKLTGMKVKALPKASPVEISLNNISHPILKGLAKGFVFGCRARELAMPDWYPEKPVISPILFSDDPKAVPLGKIVNLGLTGFAIKRFPNWRSIWISANVIPAKILRNICLYAGVHIYDYNEDIIYANRSWLAIHLASDGERRIFLPGKYEVVSAIDGKVIGKSISSFKIIGKTGETFIFRITMERRFD